MFRKISITLVLLALLSLAGGAVSADPVNGCYATASALTIKEGEAVTITLQCENIATSNNVFGFQIDAIPTGSYDVGTAPAVFTPGTFSELSTGMLTDLLVGSNTLGGLYAVSRRVNETVTATNFTLGSYALNSVENLTTDDGSIVVTVTDANFILSDNMGTELADMLRTVNDITVTVSDIDLAWLNGNVVVESEATNITSLDVIELVLGDRTPYGVADFIGNGTTFGVDTTYRFFEVGTPASNDELIITVSANMTGHLKCSNTVDLLDTGAVTDVTTKVGVSGTITLLAGDANDDGAIEIDDATAIGANFNAPVSDDRDINGDNVLNILDLVHVGRNYTALSGSCGA